MLIIVKGKLQICKVNSQHKNEQTNKDSSEEKTISQVWEKKFYLIREKEDEITRLHCASIQWVSSMLVHKNPHK